MGEIQFLVSFPCRLCYNALYKLLEVTKLENIVFATVNGNPITMTDVMGFIQAMGPQGAQYDNPQGHQVIVEQLISQQLLYLDAVKSGISFDPEFKAQLERAKKELLTSYAVTKLISTVNATEAQCKERYMEDPSAFAGQPSVNASHILVDSEETANEVKAKLAADEVSFEDAAKEYSSCPSSANGGNLGDFTRGRMVPEFEEAAFNMDVDQVSDPVKTQFGYHIIKVLNKTEAETKNFDDVKDQIMQQLTNELRGKALESKVNQLKILYPVDMKATDGKPNIII